jgi:hypothetical protein
MRPHGSMSDIKKFWGAVDKECPNCHKLTPVYPTTLKGTSKSNRCQHCSTSLQMDGNQVVVATYENIEMPPKIVQQELATIAHIAKTKLGAKEEELHPLLRNLGK